MHHQHEGTGGESQNIVLTELRTVKTTPGADRPSQNIIGQILASSTSDFFNSLSHKRTFDLDTDWLLTGGLDFLLSRYQVIDPSVSVSIAATKFLVNRLRSVFFQNSWHWIIFNGKYKTGWLAIQITIGADPLFHSKWVGTSFSNLNDHFGKLMSRLRAAE